MRKVILHIEAEIDLNGNAISINAKGEGDNFELASALAAMMDLKEPICDIVMLAVYAYGEKRLSKRIKASQNGPRTN